MVLQIHGLSKLSQEPRINGSELLNLVSGPALRERKENVAQTIGVRSDQPLRNQLRVQLLGAGRLPGLKTADALRKRLLESAPDRHHLAHGLHLSPEHRLRSRELFKLPSRNLYHHVVECWLEARRGHLSDVI